MIGIVFSAVIVLLFVGLLCMIIANIPIPQIFKNVIYVLVLIGVIIMLCHFAGINLSFGFLRK